VIVTTINFKQFAMCHWAYHIRDFSHCYMVPLLPISRKIIALNYHNFSLMSQHCIRNRRSGRERDRGALSYTCNRNLIRCRVISQVVVRRKKICKKNCASIRAANAEANIEWFAIAIHVTQWMIGTRSTGCKIFFVIELTHNQLLATE